MRKRTKSLLALLLAAVMILSSAGVSYASPEEEYGTGTEEPGEAADSGEELEESSDDLEEPSDPEGIELELEDVDPSTFEVKKLGELEEDEDELGEISLTPDTSLNQTVRVSIFLEAPAALDAGYKAQGVGTNGSAIAYRNSLKNNQRQVTAQIESAVGYSLNVKWNLTLLANAVSCYVKVKDIPVIERMSGVASVARETRYEVPREGSGNQPNTANTSSLMVGATSIWSAGYTGAGTRIAIIDTGIDATHQSFDPDALMYSIDKQGASGTLMTAADVSAVQSQLNGSGTYVNAKIPYAYNYIDNNLTIDHLNDIEGEHGSHVAGIAAANRYINNGAGYVDAASSVYAVGMAPDAQLLVMKVFGENGGAYDSDYMSAIEDAIVLGCDSCNLSLGSSAQGFTYNTTYQNIMNGLASGTNNYGMVVTMSAGNSDSLSAYLDTDLYIDDVDMHTGGSPGTFINSLCISSAENVGMTGSPLIYNGSNIYYTESTVGTAIGSIAGTYDFVYIDALGTEEDYETVNSSISLSGKIVLVNRGSISFAEKGNNAIPYSPEALVVANNQSGTIRMALDNYTGTFPMVAITLADAEMIKESAECETIGGCTCYTGRITVSDKATSDVYSTREEIDMSGFSSWGVPGSLLMKPEITAPGGNIYSVFGTNLTKSGSISGGSDRYELMNGTSMASPHIAGLAAVLAQYMKEEGVTVPGYSRRALIQSLLMSTATPMKRGNSYISILQQGAGLADASQALNARSAIFMTGARLTSETGAAADGKVKVELGDDPARTGGYSYSFRIYNLTNETVTFEAPRTDIFTQGYYTDEGETFMSEDTVRAGSQTGYTWVPSGVYANPYDVNQDGTTNSQDAQAILDFLTGAAAGTGLDLTAADFDKDGSVTSYDAYQILEYLERNEKGAYGCYIPAGGYADVSVSFSFGVDSSIYTAGAYIEGFTYVTELRSGDGAQGVQHTIPILGYYGSWTDPSMFDNTSYIDTYYGTEKTPYTGNNKTNYLTAVYNGQVYIYFGNPYMIEDEFPTDRLAATSTQSFVNIIFSLYRAAGTLGFAVSKLDALGGNVSEVLSAQITDDYRDGIWYDDENSTWRNTGRKTFSVNRSVSDYDLSEGDVFRIGYYALPEYYGMLMSGDMTDGSAGTLTKEGFTSVLLSNILGKGAFIGYDITVDDTAPEIESAVLDGTELTVTASDNENVAYIALMSLDGEIVYEEAAPGAPEGSTSFDISDFIDEVDGYLVILAADYAANETIKAVKVNDDITVKETVYVLADELVSGENYLIVNRNTAGSGYALGRSNMSAVSDAVTVNEGISETDGKVYISGTDVDETSVWTVDGNSGSFTLKNGQYYLSSGNGFGFSSSLVFSTMPKTWKAGTDTLYYMNGSYSGYYVAFAGCSWTLCNRCSSVYFFKEETITHDFDPYSISSIEVTPASIDLYKGNTVRLLLEVGPYTAKNQPVVWTSSDTAVASVDESGMVTAVGTGTAIITAASAKDSSVSAACEVNVISANKTMNGIIWDEEGREFFTTFNTDTLPAWSRNHADGYMLNLTAAFMESPNTLYAATLDYGTGETILYRVNRSSYELEEYGQNFVWALDMAIGASDPDYADYAGMVYTCGTYLVAGPIEPSDDGAGNVFCGLPYAVLNCSGVTGDAYLVGIACKERTRSGGTYYVLDEFGVIWQTTLRFSNDQEEGFCFSTPVEILDTGIFTDFLDQNLYYDGTYLYWAHTDEDYAYLYIIDLETNMIYNAGDFGVDVWPVTGMYVDGSVAPASAGGVMDDGSPANADLSGLRVAASRDALMTPQVQARLKAEAAKYAGKAKPSAEHTGEQVTGNEPVEPEEPEEPEAPAEPETPADETGEPVEVPGDEPSEGSSEGPGEENEPGDAGEETPGGTGEGSEASEEDVPPVESGEPGGAEDEAPGDEEEPEPDDPAYTGSVNAAVSTSKVKRPARNKASVTDAESGEDNTVEVRICETYDSHNGLYVISYDPAVLEYAGIKSGTASWSAHALAEAGTVTFAFADTVPAAAGQDIAVASFRRLTDSKTALTVVTKERGSRVALDEKEDITISGTELPKPAFKTQSLYLSGQIGVNFYLELPVIAGVDYSDSYMTFTVPHGTCTARADFDPNRKNRAGTYYGFTCYVNSVQMMEPITATFHYTEGDQEKTVTNTYAVNDYFNAFDKLVSEGLVTDPTTIALVRALADYGHYVQPFLAASRHWTLGADYAALEKHYTESFDTESISAPAFLKTNNTDGDITDITYSLTLDSSTAINVYFKPGSGYDGPFTASVDGGAAAQYMPGSDGRYCVRISGIPAHELSKQHTITVSTADGHTAEVTVSALCYVNAVLKNYSGTDVYDVMARNAAAALYAYSQAAGLYKTAHPNE